MTKREIDEEYLNATQVMERLTDDEDYSQDELEATSVMERYTDIEEDMPKKPVVKPSSDDEDEEEDEDDSKRSAGKEVIAFIKDLVICLVVALLFTNYIARPVQVNGRSMYPTLEDRSLGFSNVLGVNFGEIERFDIVIIYLEDKSEYIVKRVVGLPGETVSYVNGQLYINDQPIDEPFLNNEYAQQYDGNFMNDVSEITLGDDEYYCLGDNRAHSTDSRYYGPFKKSQIKSKGIFIFYPFENFGVETW